MSLDDTSFLELRRVGGGRTILGCVHALVMADASVDLVCVDLLGASLTRFDDIVLDRARSCVGD